MLKKRIVQRQGIGFYLRAVVVPVVPPRTGRPYTWKAGTRDEWLHVLHYQHAAREVAVSDRKSWKTDASALRQRIFDTTARERNEERQ
jgi:hypothetical protein